MISPATALPNRHTTITERLKKAAKKRILVLDGAMGTMIQRYQLQVTDCRGR